MKTTNKSRLAIQYIEEIEGVISAFILEESKHLLHLGVAITKGDPRHVKRAIRHTSINFALDGVKYEVFFFTQVGNEHSFF